MQQVVCWILLLQIVNISINPPDIHRQKQGSVVLSEDLSINDVESVYELVAEGVFDSDVPESEEEETDTTSSAFDLYFFNRTSIKLPPLQFPAVHFSYYSNNFTSFHQAPHSPPPKAA